MKKWISIAVGLFFVALAAAVLWPKAPPGVEGPDPELAQDIVPEPQFEPVSVSSATASGLSLTGIVKDSAGRPIADAEVSLASSAQASLLTVRCAECQALLLTCPSPQTSLRVRDLLASEKGALTAGATTQSGPDGRFRFENLAGVAFTVWAMAEGYGAAVKERAAPGDPVELFLPPERTLAGIVSDENGNAIAGAHVHVVSRAVPLPIEVTSVTGGLFEARGLGEGPFYVLAKAEGYLPAVAHSVEAGPEPVRLKLIKPRVLEVLVQRNGQRVDAAVQLTMDHRERVVQAIDGFVRLGELHPDEVWVSATAGELSSPPQRVSVIEPVTRVTLELDVAGRIAVTIVDEAGGPVPEPELFVSRTMEADPFLHRKARTGELAILGPLGTGAYVLTVEAEGYRPAQLPVRVQVGEQPIEVVMVKGTFIRGRVLDEYGRPAPRISVLVSPTGLVALADEEGRFSATVPSPGFYELQAHHSDWGGGDEKVTAPAENVELHLEPKAGLRAIVQSGGRRLEGADVALWREREAVFRNDRQSGSDGVVLMRGLPAGKYSLVASHAEFLVSARQSVELRDGELQEVVIDLRPGAAIRGRVVDEQGAPVVGANVSAVPRRADPATTDGDGRFELRPLAPQHRYHLQAMHPQYDQKVGVQATPGEELVTVTVQKRSLYRGRVRSESGEPIRSFRIDDQEITSADGTFEVPLESESGRVFSVVDAPGFQAQMVDESSETTDLGDIVLRPEAKAHGVVVDSSGAPVEGAIVTCDVCDGQVSSDAQGRFALSIPMHLASFVVMATKGSVSGTATASSQERSGVRVMVRQGVRVTGQVYLPTGAPAAGVEVEAVHLDRSEPTTVVTMQDGSYSAELPEGSYRFSLASGARAFGADPITFIFISGDAMTVNLGPAPGSGTVNVRLESQPGHALWLVKGVVTTVGSPPMELFKSAWAQLIYQPKSGVVSLTGVPPGRYTVVWSRFHTQGDSGPTLRVVDVPGNADVSLLPAPTK